MAEEKTTADVGNSPVVWLTVLQAAGQQGNTALENRAREELSKLGITVARPPATEGRR